MLLHINRLLIGAVLLLSTSLSYGASISYTVTDQPDVVSGQDIWHYDYQVSGDFLAFEGFNLYFDSSLYSNLQDPPTISDPASWFTLVTQPDPGLSAPGIFTALAQTDLTNVQANFGLDFIWLGTRQPGVQRFELVDSLFNVTATGNTQLAGTFTVPEPGSILLIFSGLALLKRSRQTTLVNANAAV